MGIVNLWLQFCCELQGAYAWLSHWQWPGTNTEDSRQPEFIIVEGSTGISGSCQSTAVRAVLRLNICSVQQKTPPNT